MSNDLEEQREEQEVLQSIYYGDPLFKEVSSTTYQYKCGDDGEPNSLLLEVSWHESYPTEKPIINLDMYYNNHLSVSVKNYIREKLDEKAEQYLGVAVTYTLFELAKEKIDVWIQEAPKAATIAPHILKTVTDDKTAIEDDPTVDISKLDIADSPLKKAAKKEQLSKAQKRRQWDRCEGREDKPRGYNWVDVVKHLSQSGGKLETCDMAGSSSSNWY